MHTSEPHRRKISAGVAMIAAPLFLGAAYLIGPSTGDNTTEEWSELAAAGWQLDVAVLLYITGLVLFVFATFGLVHLLPENQAWLGQIGGALAVIGLLLTGAMTGMYIGLIETARLDVASAVSAAQNLESSAVPTIVHTASIAFPVGMIVLAVGLALARTAQMWAAPLLGAGVIVTFVGDFTTATLVSVVGIALVFLALAPIGYELLAEPDDAWEHPVRHEGLGLAVGAH